MIVISWNQSISRLLIAILTTFEIPSKSIMFPQYCISILLKSHSNHHFSSTIPWCSHIFTIFLWFSYDFHISPGFPLVFLWFSPPKPGTSDACCSTRRAPLRRPGRCRASSRGSATAGAGPTPGALAWPRREVARWYFQLGCYIYIYIYLCIDR